METLGMNVNGGKARSPVNAPQALEAAQVPQASALLATWKAIPSQFKRVRALASMTDEDFRAMVEEMDRRNKEGMGPLGSLGGAPAGRRSEHREAA